MFKKILITLPVAGILAIGPMTAQAQVDRPVFTPKKLASTGQAYGTSVKNNSMVASGPTAPVYMCTAKAKKKNENYIESTGSSVPVVADGVTTWTKRSKVNGNPASTTVSKIAEVSLPDSALKLVGITARTRIVALPDGTYFRNAKTSVLKVKLAGQVLPLDVIPGNQVIEIPGVATLKFNMTKNFSLPRGAGVRAVAAKIILQDEDQTTVRVAKASSTLVPDTTALVRGNGYALNASVLGDLVNVGRVAKQPLPCTGTNSEVKENATAGITIPGVLSVDGAFGRAYSTQTKREVTALTEGGVATLNLGDGQLVVTGLTSSATVTKLPGGKRVFSTEGSHVLSLTVQGEPQEVPLDGQVIEVPGVARIEFGVITKKKTGFERVAALVTLLDGSGAVIPVGVASAYVL